MKKTLALIITLCLLATAFAGCDTTPEVTTDAGNPTPQDTTAEVTAEQTDEVTEAEQTDVNGDSLIELEGVQTVDYESLAADDTITITGGDVLNSYFEKSSDEFFGVCKYFADKGFEQYSYSEIKGSYYATYTKGAEMAHLYWIACEGELNIVYSQTAGSTLPPKTPQVTTGDKKTTVTQLKSPEINGMGYVIQLEDGSFIIYDGGYAHRSDELWDILTEQNGGTEGIVIRAWVLTHSHNDHYPCFVTFAAEHAADVKLETVIICPLEKKDVSGAGNDYFFKKIFDDIAKFDGVKTCFAHTGMHFTFCNLKMEVLISADDVYISDPPTDKDFNNTSLVTRLYSDNYSMIFLGDAGDEAAMRLMVYYGDYLKSDMCQISHHGVEDFPLIAYRMIQAEILWYPCTTYLYEYPERDQDVKQALKKSKYTKEVILQDKRATRPFGN